MFTPKKSLLAVSIITLSLATGAFSLVNAASHAKAEDANADVVIAEVNGDKIMKSTLDGYLAILKKQKQGNANTQAAVNDLVATEIALQEAKKTDILERPASKKAISDYTRNILLQTWTKEKIASFKNR